jgi:hypothetical protein
MHVLINVKSPNNISKWQIGFNSAFKVLIRILVRNADKGLSNLSQWGVCQKRWAISKFTYWHWYISTSLGKCLDEYWDHGLRLTPSDSSPPTAAANLAIVQSPTHVYGLVRNWIARQLHGTVKYKWNMFVKLYRKAFPLKRIFNFVQTFEILDSCRAVARLRSCRMLRGVGW